MKNRLLIKMVILIIIFIFIQSVCIAGNAINLNLYTKSYIAYERNTKQVLFGKNTDVKVPMASTTKIMTAILTLEYGKLNETVTITKNAQNTSGWQLNLKEGDKIKLKDLLYAIMLYSANDGAIAIAEHIGGSVENFCEMMNNKAKEIGALNTNFTSPHGLDNDNHYSTPYDLALITDYAMNNENFCKIVTTPSYSIMINENIKNVNNTNKLINSVSGITGVKTGYTGKAGYCLVSGIKTTNLDVICVTLGSGTSKNRFDESKKILEHCKDNYILVDLKDYIKESIKIDINKSNKDNVNIYPQNINKIPILKQNINKINVKYEILNNQIAPINKDKVLGVAKVYIDNEMYTIINYTTNENIQRNNYIDYFRYIVFSFRDFMLLYI